MKRTIFLALIGCSFSSFGQGHGGTAASDPGKSGVAPNTNSDNAPTGSYEHCHVHGVRVYPRGKEISDPDAVGVVQLVCGKEGMPKIAFSHLWNKDQKKLEKMLADLKDAMIADKKVTIRYRGETGDGYPRGIDATVEN